MSDKPKIFVFVAGGRGTSWVRAMALSEDGEVLAGHICSHEGFIPGDMGLTSDWKHDLYSKKYPDGFELKFLSGLEMETDQQFQQAVQLFRAGVANGD